MPDNILQFERTRTLHAQLAEVASKRPAELQAAVAVGNAELRKEGIFMQLDRPLEMVPSAMILSPADIDRLKEFAHEAFELIEEGLARVIASPRLLAKHFPHQQRFAPYFAKTRGCPSWQVISRYDLAISDTGEIKLLELNSGSPGACMILEGLSRQTQLALAKVGLNPLQNSASEIATINPQEYIQSLLDIERTAGIAPTGVAVVCDENKIMYELAAIADGFRAAGREAIVGEASQLQLAGGVLSLAGRPISLVYNKLRASTPDSPGFRWRTGFEDRYESLLEAQATGAAVVLSNLCAHTLGDDKTLLALICHPDVANYFSSRQREFIERHIPFTARLAAGPANWRGRTVDLMQFAREHRQDLIVKPCCQSQGYGVVIGRYVDGATWERTITPNAKLPCVLQEFAPTLQLPVTIPDPSAGASGWRTESMSVVLGINNVAGNYLGLISRMSPKPVVNVALGGFDQAIFVSP